MFNCVYMAIIHSPLLTASYGSIGDVTFRRVDGRVIASRRRCARTVLSSSQVTQVSYFGLAVKCLEYLPAYYRIAYAKIGHKSAWNIATSIAVRALKSQVAAYDVSPSALLLLKAMADEGVQPSIGVQSPATAMWSDGSVVVSCADGVWAHLWVVGTDATKMASYAYKNMEDGVSQFAVPDGSAAAVVSVSMADGTPITSDSTFIHIF